MDGWRSISWLLETPFPLPISCKFTCFSRIFGDPQNIQNQSDFPLCVIYWNPWKNNISFLEIKWFLNFHRNFRFWALVFRKQTTYLKISEQAIWKSSNAVISEKIEWKKSTRMIGKGEVVGHIKNQSAPSGCETLGFCTVYCITACPGSLFTFFVYVSKWHPCTCTIG